MVHSDMLATFCSCKRQYFAVEFPKCSGLQMLLLRYPTWHHEAVPASTLSVTIVYKFDYFAVLSGQDVDPLLALEAVLLQCHQSQAENLHPKCRTCCYYLLACWLCWSCTINFMYFCMPTIMGRNLLQHCDHWHSICGLLDDFHTRPCCSFSGKQAL